MDTTAQIVLIIMVLVLGSTLTIVGIMLFFVLKDLRESIQKANLIMTDFEVVSKRIASGSEQIDEAIMSLRTTIDTIKNQAASPIGSVFGIVNLVRSLMNDGKGGNNQ